MTENDLSFTCNDLTPQALRDALTDLGGGIVLGVVLAVQVATGDGGRTDLTLWDNEAAVSTQLGLSDLLHRVMDARADLSCGRLGDPDV